MPKLAAATVALLAVVSALVGFTGEATAATQAIPANTSPPTITGTAQVGQTLRANNGTWSNSPTSFVAQWRRCSAAGDACATIAAGSSYVLVAADAGRTLRVLVIARNADGAAAAGSAPTAVVRAAAPATVPVNTSPPAITGTTQVGQTLRANNGTWSNSPTSFVAQWRRCSATGDACATIAAGSNYVLVAADAGRTLRVLVIARNAAGAGAAQSAPTAVVRAAGPATVPVNTSPPTITGTPQVGQELLAGDGGWSGSPESYSYQWQRCDADVASCSNVFGATGKSYGVRIADLGYRLRLGVAARNARGSANANSAITAVVAPVVAITNRRPAVRILSLRFTGARVYARFRICDDTAKNLTVLATESRPNRLSYTRRLITLVPPRPCGVYTRNWLPLVRFRGPGRYTVTLRARDTSGLTSLPVRRIFNR